MTGCSSDVLDFGEVPSKHHQYSSEDRWDADERLDSGRDRYISQVSFRKAPGMLGRLRAKVHRNQAWRSLFS
jgi:hypothetical protein